MSTRSGSSQGGRGLRPCVLLQAGQRATVLAHTRLQSLTVVAAYTDETGRRCPQLDATLARTRQKEGVLLIARLDQPARNVVVVASLVASGVPFIAVGRPEAHNLTTPVMAAVAEYEAAPSSQRTRAASDKTCGSLCQLAPGPGAQPAVDVAVKVGGCPARAGSCGPADQVRCLLARTGVPGAAAVLTGAGA